MVVRLYFDLNTHTLYIHATLPLTLNTHTHTIFTIEVEAHGNKPSLRYLSNTHTLNTSIDHDLACL